MTDIKATIAKNITELRTSRGMTQLELAEQLHYSDKAVSKWERGESVPEISTLKAIADLFGVTLDYLVQEEHGTSDTDSIPEAKRKKRNRSVITAMSVILVWFLALFSFVVIDIVPVEISTHWLSFLYALAVSLIVWLVFNSVWFNRRFNYVIISLFVWSLLACVHVTFLVYGKNIWQIFLLGIPAQLVILLWSRLRSPKKKADIPQNKG